MLTAKQRELLLFINQRLMATGVSPSFDEMKDALRLKSKSGIHRLVSGLEERGFIRRLPHRARALEVVKLPEESAAPAGDRSGFSATVIRGDFKASLPGAPVAPDVEAVELPLYGRIAAGTPIEALRDQSASVGVPASLLGRVGEHYALEVAGDSMIDAGILDGDTVIIERGDTAENGCDRRRADRRPGGDAEAAAPPRRLDRARTRQQGLRNPHLRPRPGQGAGPPRRSVAPLLRARRHSILFRREGAEDDATF